MNKLLFAGAFAASLALPSLSFAHGGTYRGPGDTTPPSGGGGGGGGGPTTPGPAGPGAPGPNGPTTPGATTPGAPAGSPGGPAKPRTGSGDNGPDLTVWQFWWAFNKDPYLNLKSHINGGTILTGSDDFYLGRGEHGQSKDTLRVSEETIRTKIVPRLLDALDPKKGENSNDIQSSCMVALAKIGDAKTEDGKSEFAASIKRFLTSGSQELSETAAVALGILANRDNIELLSAVLNNDQAKLRSLEVPQTESVNVRTRAFAAYGLGLIGYKALNEDREAINATLRKILDGEGKTMGQRDIQVACLTAMGLSPLDINHDDKGPEEGKKTKAPESLKTRQDQLRYLLSYYMDESNNYLIRAHAPTAMGRLLSTGEVPTEFAYRDLVATTLMESLSKDSKAQDAMQQSCALALGVIGDSDEDPIDKAIRGSLMRVKDDLVDQQVRNFALIGLAQAAGRAGHGAGDPTYGVNAKDKKENARIFLQNELAKGKSAVKPWSGLAIAVMERELDDAKQGSSTDMKLLLRTALTDAKSPEDIGAFAISCGLVKDVGAKDVLIHNLDSVRDVEARGYTAIGLGLMDEQSAIPAIQEIVKKTKYQAELLKNAAIALGLLGDKQLVPDLVAMLKTANGLSAQTAISSALGYIGDSRSVDSLIELMQDQEVSALARAFGAVALGIIADKEPFPWNSKIGVNSNYRANTPSLTDQKGGILDIL
ncbi:MAG TPA: HEAT repeat domain-containing protein [Planctomycetota bacterium]|nr:HEAT repeat domain-containing protein [Planctomycetota bacterium]